MKYGFSMSQCDILLYVRQVSSALEKRTELISRKKYPKLWEKTDKINEKNGLTEKEAKFHIRGAGIVCLVLGILLVLLGSVKPKELLSPILVGILGIIMGIRSLFRSRKNSNMFDRSAVKLLKHENQVLSGTSVTVGFEENIVEIHTLSVKTGKMDKEKVDYTTIEYFFETADVFIMIYQEKILVLKKQDLVAKTIEEFINFIRNKVEYISLA